jgi:predicted RND superfamily exporter protein
MNIMEMQDMAFLGGQDKVDNKCQEIVGDPEISDSRNIIRELLQLVHDENGNEQQVVRQGLTSFQSIFAPYFKDSVLKMTSTDPIIFEELPPSILDRYSNKTRDQFLVTIFPAGIIYDGAFWNRFVDDLERVNENVTGMPPLMLALIRIFGRDGRNAMLLTMVIVFFLLFVDFQSPRRALMAMIPLALGIFWMVGLMRLFGMKLNIMNVIGLPLIIGIGIDDGVHIMHRWRHEGKGKIRTVFSSTGKAILLTSLTTMLAFGSLIFSIYPAWGMFGGALAIGVGACFLTSVIILPGVLGFIESRNKKKERIKS